MDAAAKAAEDARRAEPRDKNVLWWQVEKLEKVAAADPAMKARGIRIGVFHPDGRVDTSRRNMRRIAYSQSGRSISVAVK